MGKYLDAWKDFVRLTNETTEAKEQIVGWDRVFQFTVEGGKP